MDDIDDDSLKEELRACEHFFVDSEFERGRHKVFNYAFETLNTEFVNNKLDYFFNNLKFAAKLNLAFGLIFKNLEDGRYRSTRTKTILCWIDFNLCAPKTT